MGRIVEIPHTKTIEKVIQTSDSDIDQGLQSQNVQTRTEKYGANILDEKETVTPLRILFHNANNIIVYLLLIASLVAFLMGDHVEGSCVSTIF